MRERSGDEAEAARPRETGEGSPRPQPEPGELGTEAVAGGWDGEDDDGEPEPGGEREGTPRARGGPRQRARTAETDERHENHPQKEPTASRQRRGVFCRRPRGGDRRAVGAGLRKGFRGPEVGTVWREAPSLADPLGRPSGRPGPHRYAGAPAGAKRHGGWHQVFGGERERGFGENQTGLLASGSKPPSSHVSPTAPVRKGGLEERPHRKGRRQGKLRRRGGGSLESGTVACVGIVFLESIAASDTTEKPRPLTAASPHDRLALRSAVRTFGPFRGAPLLSFAYHTLWPSRDLLER